MNLRVSSHTATRPRLAIAAGLLLVMTGIGLWLWLSGAGSGIKRDGYQLVTLSSGETYIGQLRDIRSRYVTLRDVYYQQKPAAGASASSVTVLSLSSAVAKPEGTMYIANDKIVHWENLAADSKVVQAIRQQTAR